MLRQDNAIQFMIRINLPVLIILEITDTRVVYSISAKDATIFSPSIVTSYSRLPTPELILSKNAREMSMNIS
jgi:hypothetical protein